jgi:hypothetical protein
MAQRRARLRQPRRRRLPRPPPMGPATRSAVALEGIVGVEKEPATRRCRSGYSSCQSITRWPPKNSTALATLLKSQMPDFRGLRK